MSEIQKQELTSLNIAENQLQKLKEIFPEAFTEGNKVDWDKLRLTLGESIDTGKERFGMNWPGKADCFKTIQQPSIATLVPDREESINFDTTENLFIEGDNLEVLKLLQKSYLGKVKMIYIDPPYNTGNEFIYPDNYSENLNTYLEYTGQIDGEGRKFSTNTETDGRFHSKWLNMMYPRLFLAKNLLSEDGVIFVSIDDNEVHNLKSLCNEIFGEENFVADMIWQKKTGSSDANNIATITEYILVYAKQIANLKFNQDEEAHDENRYKFKDEYFEERGPFYYDNLDRGTLGYHQSLDYGVSTPDVNLTFPNGRTKQLNDGWRWKWGKDKLDWGIKNGYIEVQPSSSKDSGWGVYYKIYLNVDNEGNRIKRSSPYKNLLQGILNTHASNEAKELFNKTGIFSNPKPVNLIKKLLIIGTKPDDLILDFFAGSATIAQATMELNKKDGGSRKFICIQLPEPTDEKSEAYKAGYTNIAEVSKERIRRAIKKIENEEMKIAEAKKQTTNQEVLTFAEPKLEYKIEKKKQDLGFKVFKLQKSNFKIWDANVSKEPEDIQQALFEHIDHISPEAAQEAVLYELLLKSGFPLATPIETITFADKNVYSIADGELLICLEKQLTNEVINAMAEKQPTRVICLDEGFQNNDQLKTNAVKIMASKGVVNFRTV
jgi:adenine-specific DNA-methyltransferase